MILLPAYLGKGANVNSHRLSSTSGKVALQAGVPHGLDDRGRQHTAFVGVADVAARLDVCERTVRRWIKAGALPVHRIGGLVRISEADFAAFLALLREA
jgi:excisionase family DNA binding protein